MLKFQTNITVLGVFCNTNQFYNILALFRGRVPNVKRILLSRNRETLLTVRIFSVAKLFFNNSSYLLRRFVLREQIFLGKVGVVGVLLREIQLDLRILDVYLLRFGDKVVMRPSV